MDIIVTHCFNLELSTRWHLYRSKLHQRNAQRDASIDADISRFASMASPAMGQSRFIFKLEFIYADQGADIGLVLPKNCSSDLGLKASN